MQSERVIPEPGQEPYEVRAVLKESSTVDPDTGTGICFRYTELIAEDGAPETLKKAVDECNKRAAQAVEGRIPSAPPELSAAKLQKKTDAFRFSTYAYITAVTRADDTAFSILETEYEAGLWDAWKGQEVSYHFSGNTYDTASGAVIQLAELTDDGQLLSDRLNSALQTQYGTAGLAGTGPENFSWTADALGIRFYFNSAAVSKNIRQESGDYADDVITVAFPYDQLDGAAAEKLAEVPENYIARIDRETVYDLPHGNLSVMLTKAEDGTYIRMMPDHGQESRLAIEYADKESQYYIIRSKGGFYLFRERAGYEEGFFYDFSRPDGGFGRFAYNNCQYFDSFMREINLALPYDPDCVHMCEVRRSFGERIYDNCAFVPNGHYSFPDEPKGRYKRFVLIDGKLKIDTLNTACRLLEDMQAVEISDRGDVLGEITVPAGSTLIFEAVEGEADRYQIPTQRGRNKMTYCYDCRLSDGRMVRITSDSESVLCVSGKYMNRFTEPVSLAEVKISAAPGQPEVFTVSIGGKDYPVIPDYSKADHRGEEIDFGTDIWWQVEGYSGHYIMTDEDVKDMQNNWAGGSQACDRDSAMLDIGKDGKVRFVYYGRVYEGMMPDRRYYAEEVRLVLKSEAESRAFSIVLRDRELHKAPSRIEFYSQGLPATNVPSKQPPLSVYLTKQ